ncbi:MAG TPA: phosphoenolpyruvate synthase, partial [Gammaproteobacteria bacterium]|nr:phosphoenolpyruvate synthase [Gammaproteobacteria bacterium]
IIQAYHALSQDYPDCAFAVRSSATAEDLPDASFAGQQETYLNIKGQEAILEKVKAVYASLFTDRAIAYRTHQGFKHEDVSLSVGIQRMVRSDLASSGVMFSCDTESGFDKVVFITSSYGLGEMIVQGSVNPDEFYVYKPTVEAGKFALLRRSLGSKQEKMIYAKQDDNTAVKVVKVDPLEQAQFSITDQEAQELARNAILIENHYGRSMDIEWAKDGIDNQLYILQARPETVKSLKKSRVIERYALKGKSKVFIEGRSIGQRIGVGVAKIIHSIKDIDKIQVGDVLVTDMTDPDWEPIMKKAAAIVTNRGGRTCHAAIIAREMGIPAVVGCKTATQSIPQGEWVTVSCSEGDVGKIYQGKLPFEINKHSLDDMPSVPFKIMMNVANPDRAFDFQFLPNEGVGLARLEFIISQMIGIHPRACLEFGKLQKAIQMQIQERIRGYDNPQKFYVQKLAEGIATIAGAFDPKPVIIRFSDFKSNEYANLIGGKEFEPDEENPMLGFRGASRYVSSEFKACFALECEAVKWVRNEMGLKNIEVMIPFVRSVMEAKAVLAVMAENGLRRHEAGLRIIMMCELPTNALLAEEYLEYFDGFSIGSNDLTQLTLGLDRDSALVAAGFDERDLAVKKLLREAIQACKKMNKYVGICGQGPSDHPDFAKWLVNEGIDSVSLNPDSVLETWLYLAKG